ncbi:MAG: FKBP-type peptidyl-prolyl cis-trans isomerase [Bacteroidales bacterium]
MYTQSKQLKKRVSKFLNLIILLLASTVVLSCLNLDSEYEKQVARDDAALAQYLQDNNLDALQHPTGFYYQKLSGDSEVELKKDDVVSFIYSIYTLDGHLVQSNGGEEGVPALIKLQSMTVIPQALDEGISLMKLGDKFRFYIPSYLAYGTLATTDFSANSSFIVDVETIEVREEEEIFDEQRAIIENYAIEHYSHLEYEITESGLIIVDTVTGSGTYPQEGYHLILDLKRKYLDNTVTLSNSQLVLTFGQGNTPALEEGVKKIKMGGSAILLAPSDLGFRQSACVIPQKLRSRLYLDRILSSNVEPYSILKYVVAFEAIYF